MQTTRILILTLPVVVALVLSAGCTGLAGTDLNGGPPAAVDIPGTPVHYAEVNGASLGYREFGTGEPILLVAGIGSTMDNWDADFVGALASKYHVYLYDRRGLGFSPDNAMAPSVSQHADDAAGLIAAIGHGRMNVYGLSMGSSIAQQLVIDHPGSVEKLILSSTTYSVRIPECAGLLSELESIAADPSKPDAVRHEAEASLAWNGTYDGLAGIERDVMLIVGTNDTLTPDSISVRMVGEIDSSWLVRFAGISHGGENEAPDEYARAVETFLATAGTHG